MPDKSDAASLMNAISDLSMYLSRPEITPALLSQYLALKTLAPVGANQIFISQLHPDGMVRRIDSFGYTDEQIHGWEEFPLSSKLPVTDAIRNDQLVWLADHDDWEKDYPELASYPGEITSQTFIAISIDIHGAPAGALGIMSQKQVHPTPELISFISAIGGMVALYLSRVNQGRFANVVRGNEGANGEFLTPRQMRILDFMAQSFTNPQIAKELGFSESTVRQETMRIYQILQVSGRKEAIKEAQRRNIAS
jgi:DNA-binding CsgD family transcriptional regulator